MTLEALEQVIGICCGDNDSARRLIIAAAHEWDDNRIAQILDAQHRIAELETQIAELRARASE